MSDADYRKLSKGEIAKEMSDLKNWRIVEGKLHRKLRFESFEDAMAFMQRSALEISKLNHHPEWFNVYNEVRIDLVTHDVRGISNYDFLLARKLAKIARMFRAK